MAITYTTNVNDIPIDGLGNLEESVGWKRTDDMTQKKMLAGSDWVIGAKDGEKLVGFVRVCGDGVIYAFATNLMVHSDYRRQGIAREMMTRLKKWVMENNFGTLRLFAYVKGDPGLFGFYEKLGYERWNNAMRMKGMEF